MCLSATTLLCTNTAHFLLKTIRSDEARHRCGRALAQVLILHLLHCRSICLGENAHGEINGRPKAATGVEKRVHLSLTRLQRAGLLLFAWACMLLQVFGVHLVTLSRSHMQICVCSSLCGHLWRPSTRKSWRSTLMLKLWGSLTTLWVKTPKNTLMNVHRSGVWRCLRHTKVICNHYTLQITLWLLGIYTSWRSGNAVTQQAECTRGMICLH